MVVAFADTSHFIACELFLYVAESSKPVLRIDAALVEGVPPALPRKAASGRFTSTSFDKELYASTVSSRRLLNKAASNPIFFTILFSQCRLGSVIWAWYCPKVGVCPAP